MSNINLEANSEDTDPNRGLQQATTTNPAKKRGGFQITSVTDSVHGRPASIVRDGEESADDLDESHASYSDVSYSRTTDADHDQESTASEDTLNISVHETANADTAVNHISAIHSTHHIPHPGQTLTSGLSLENLISKHNLQKDLNQDPKVVQHAPNLLISKASLSKQQSEHLDSPQELPHDNVHTDNKDRKSDSSDKKGDLPQSSGTNNKVSSPLGQPEQSTLNTATVSSSNIPTTIAVQSPLSSLDSAESTTSAEKTSVTSTAIVSAPLSKSLSVSSTTSSSKAPGTRVYKVVKREATQPTKRVRGRWNWHDFSDTQTPMIGLSNTAVSAEQRIANNANSLQTFTYTNTLMSAGVVPYPLHQSPSSFFKDHILSAELSNNPSSSARDETALGLQTDALKTAIKQYAVPSDAATGDTSAATRSLKIDYKIEAAMDLVKKHLMSAVRDEVDELKEKIKDLTEEAVRLKTENKELKAVMPPELLSKVQAMIEQAPPQEISTSGGKVNGEHKVSASNASQPETQAANPQDQSLPKGMNAAPSQEGSTSHMSSVRPAEHKVKITNSNTNTTQAIQQNQRQDAQKAAVSNSTSTVSQSSHPATPHMQIQHTHSLQTALETHMHEQGHMPSQENHKPNQRTHDHNFERKNPS